MLKLFEILSVYCYKNHSVPAYMSTEYIITPCNNNMYIITNISPIQRKESEVNERIDKRVKSSSCVKINL